MDDMKPMYAVRTITCKGCGETFTKRMRPDQSYCSLECYRRSARPQRRTGETRKCARCGEFFYAQASRINLGGGHYCSIACHNAAQGDGKTSHVCVMCGATFRWSPSRSTSGNYNIRYCSLVCRDADPERREMLLRMNTEQQRRGTTKAERIGYALLDGLGIEYVAQPTFAGKFTPDAAVPSARLIVQFDGDYWHDRNGTSQEARIQRRVSLDRSQDRYIRQCGWEVVRLWESDLVGDPDGCAARISQLAHRPLGEPPALDPLAPRSGLNADA